MTKKSKKAQSNSNPRTLASLADFSQVLQSNDVHNDQTRIKQNQQQQQKVKQRPAQHEPNKQTFTSSTKEEFPALPTPSSVSKKNVWCRRPLTATSSKSSMPITQTPTRILTRPKILTKNNAGEKIVLPKQVNNKKRPPIAEVQSLASPKSSLTSTATVFIPADDGPAKSATNKRQATTNISSFNKSNQQISTMKKKILSSTTTTTTTSLNSQKKSKVNHRTINNNNNKNIKQTVTKMAPLKRKKTTINTKSKIANTIVHDSIHLENMLPMGNTVVKGRQKLRARKKRLTSLKKRVLMERLDQWREHSKKNKTNDDNGNGQLQKEQETEDIFNDGSSTVVWLHGFINPEELEDEEEYDEIVSDLTKMANKVFDVAVGCTETSTLENQSNIYIPRKCYEQQHVGWAFINFDNNENAVAAIKCWNDLVIGGNRLNVGLISMKQMMKHHDDILFNAKNKAKIKYQLKDEAIVGKDLDWKEVVNCMSLTDQVMKQICSEDQKVIKHNNDISSCSVTVEAAKTEKLWGVYLDNVLTEDDCTDEECLEETKEDVKILAGKYGPVHDLIILKNPGCEQVKGNNNEECNDGGGLINDRICVYYESKDVATRAVQGLNGMNIGGEPIIATLTICKSDMNLPSSLDNKHKKDESILILENILTEDDFEDEECQEETKADILKLVEKYGIVDDITLELDGRRKGEVVIRYNGSHEIASIASRELNGMSIGGQLITARQLDHSNTASLNGSRTSFLLTNDAHPESNCPKYEGILVLENILTEDDYEDEECREETKTDIMDLVGKYGLVLDVTLELEGDYKGHVFVRYGGDGIGSVTVAVKELNGMTISGRQIKARQYEKASNDKPIHLDNSSSLSNDNINVSSNSNLGMQKNPADPEPMFSGGKQVPEQYAICKRVPKIPTPPTPREYASKIAESEVVLPLLLDMLGELMRLQKRAKDDKNARARRRLVMGLREVARGIRARKVKMVVMANNLDMYGAIDSKLQEILDLATEKDVPVFFELNKKKLGKALGKTIKVAVVGIQSADGAYEPFKKLKKLANC